jgi:hypothetical protein
MPQHLYAGKGLDTCRVTNGKLGQRKTPAMLNVCPPLALADLAEPTRFPHQLNVKVDGRTLDEIDRLARLVGSHKGTVARRLLHLGLAKLQAEEVTPGPQG